MSSIWTSLDSLEEWDAKPWDGRNFETRTFALLPLSVAQGVATLVLNLLIVLAAMRSGMYLNPSNVLMLALSGMYVTYVGAIVLLKSIAWFAQEWPLAVCQVDAVLSVLFLSILITLMLMLAIERWLVCIPMKKIDYMTSLEMVLFSISVGITNGGLHYGLMHKPVISRSGLFCTPNFGNGHSASTWLVGFNMIAASVYVVSISVVYSAIIRNFHNTIRVLALKQSAIHLSPRQDLTGSLSMSGSVSESIGSSRLDTSDDVMVSVCLTESSPGNDRLSGVPAQPTDHARSSPLTTIAESKTLPQVPIVRTGARRISGNARPLSQAPKSSEAQSPRRTTNADKDGSSVSATSPASSTSASGTPQSSHASAALQAVRNATISRTLRTSDARTSTPAAATAAPDQWLHAVNPATLFAPSAGAADSIVASGFEGQCVSQPSFDGRQSQTQLEDGARSEDATIRSMDIGSSHSPSANRNFVPAVPIRVSGEVSRKVSVDSAYKRQGKRGAHGGANPGSAPGRRGFVKVEMVLVRRGLFIFVLFVSTWMLMVLKILLLYLTKRRSSAEYDTAVSFTLWLAPLAEPIIIMYYDRKWRRAVISLLELLVPCLRSSSSRSRPAKRRRQDASVT